MKKRQVILIHEGATYPNCKKFIKSLRNEELNESALSRKEKKDWKDTLGHALGFHYEVIYPEMPNWMNARYFEWKIWFEKLSAVFNGPVVLIGHSLGGIFLARYLGENILKKKVEAVFLIASPYKLKNKKKPLGDFYTPAELSKITGQCKEIFIYHSQDDPVVPFKENYPKYIAALPGAQGVVFKNKKHFNQGSFSKLVKTIHQLDVMKL